MCFGGCANQRLPTLATDGETEAQERRAFPRVRSQVFSVSLSPGSGKAKLPVSGSALLSSLSVFPQLFL